MFKINSKLINQVPIDLRNTQLIAIGQPLIEVVATKSLLLNQGVKFKFADIAATYEVQVSEETTISPGLNNIPIAPSLVEIPANSATANTKGKHGNPIQQLVPITYYARMSFGRITTRPKNQKPEDGGTNSLEYKITGRIVKPMFLPPYFTHGRMYIAQQTSHNLISEGYFISEPFTSSTLGLEEIFGDKLSGWYGTDTIPRLIEGTIYEGCC
jgi:hypothetical protein